MSAGARGFLPFRAVNRRGRPGHDAGLQRHHLLPRQALESRAFARMFAAVGGNRHRFGDFRANGLLLPCRECAALRMGLPLHRGPHRGYNGMVIERVGQIEMSWSAMHGHAPQEAAAQVAMRLALLQGALRRYLLDGRRRAALHSRDPLGHGIDFSSLDALAEALWGATGPSARDQPMPARTRNSSFAA